MYIVPIVDQTMLAGICGLAEGGIYTTIIYMTSAMQMPYRSIVKVSTPVVTNLWKERDMEGTAEHSLFSGGWFCTDYGRAKLYSCSWRCHLLPLGWSRFFRLC